MNDISFGVFLLAIFFLLPYYWQYGSRKTKVWSIVGWIIIIFLWFGVTAILSIPTHFISKLSGYITTAAILLYCVTSDFGG